MPKQSPQLLSLCRGECTMVRVGERVSLTGRWGGGSDRGLSDRVGGGTNKVVSTLVEGLGSEMSSAPAWTTAR